MADTIKVVLFDDTAEGRTTILRALNDFLGTDGEVLPFEETQFKEEPADKVRMYEDRIESILKNPPFEGVSLIVADRDLSKSGASGFVGLSDEAVLSASRKLNIPVCSYARQQELDDYDWRERWEEGHIILSLSDGEEEMSRRAILVARGFAEIGSKLPEVMKTNSSPAKMLAALLGKPEYSDKIALYGVGDKNRLTGLPPRDKSRELRERKLTTFLGYWLWDSLLRYPGLFVNRDAASSYLNIATEDFLRPEVQDLFRDALYGGPFVDEKKPQWWRGGLDDIVSVAECEDGLQFAQKEVDSKINHCQCSVDTSKTAGYYCIISHQPVSLENSKGGLSWFPRGADLTRISTPMFEEYEPWLGS